MLLNYLGVFDNLATNPNEGQARLFNKHNAAVRTVCVPGGSSAAQLMGAD